MSASLATNIELSSGQKTKTLRCIGEQAVVYQYLAPYILQCTLKSFPSLKSQWAKHSHYESRPTRLAQVTVHAQSTGGHIYQLHGYCTYASVPGASLVDGAWTSSDPTATASVG